MPVQVPQWTEYLNCPVCYNKYNDGSHLPISLACSHTLCKACLSKLHQKRCPLDQSSINKSIDTLPVNSAIIQLVGGKAVKPQNICNLIQAENEGFYFTTMKFVEDLAVHLKNATLSTPAPSESSGANGSCSLSRPMQRKLVSLINCQLVEDEGRARAMRAARSLGERTVTELILHHQNPQQLSANLWASVRARGCQFLGPAMQEEVLRLILLALEDGSALSRKVLVLFVVQRLEPTYPHASKTAIGHVVQLLYRASCFKVTKREEESSLMQLKEEFRTYDTLRREHDSQIVQIATEAGLRIAPEQWSSLLYGDTNHKSHMQSIIDKLQTPQSFAQSVDELVIALQRTGDPGNLSHLRVHLDLLANIDPGPDTPAPSWENLEAIIKSTYTIVKGLVEFIHTNSLRKYDPPNIHGSKYKTSMCRDFVQKKTCPRGVNCTFAHSEEEMERYRAKNRRGRLQMRPGGFRDDMDALSDVTGTLSLSEADIFDPTLELDPSLVLPRSEPSTNGNSGIDPMVDLTKQSELGQERPQVPSTQTRPTSLIGPKGDIRPQDIRPYKPLEGAAQLAAGKTPGLIRSPGYEPLRYSSAERLHPPNLVARGLAAQAPSQYPRPLYEETYRYPSRYVRPTQYLGDQYFQSLPTYQSRGPPRDYLPPLNRPQFRVQHPGYRYPQGTPHSHVLEDLYQQREELIAHLTRCSTPPSGHLSERQPRPNGPGSISSNVISQRIRTDTLAASQRSVTAAELARSISDTAGTIKVNSSLGKMKHSEEQERNLAKFLDQHPATSMYRAWSRGTDMLSSSDNYTTTCQLSKSITQEQEATCITEIKPSEEPILTESTVSSASDDISLSATSGDDADDDEEAHFNIAELDKFWAIDLSHEDDDSFIPFTDQPIVSKYGPISRSARAKMKTTGPLDATATQETGTTPVTAVTPMSRPYPITSQVPSRYVGNVALMAPKGHTIARSLPTAELKVQSGVSTPASIQSMRQRVENLPTETVPGPPSTAEREQLRSELERLDQQIMLITEDEAIVQQQLQAVEMNIQAESAMIPLPSGHQYRGMYPPDYEQSYDPCYPMEQQYDSILPQEQAYDPRLQGELPYDPRHQAEQPYDPRLASMDPAYDTQFAHLG